MKAIVTAILVSWAAVPVWAADQPAVEQLTGAERGRRAWAEVQSGALLLDVRTPDEFAAGHVKGAKLIPVQVLAEWLSELPKDQRIVVYCRSGKRSAQAANLLREEGFQVFDLGPMSNWPAM